MGGCGRRLVTSYLPGVKARAGKRREGWGDASNHVPSAASGGDGFGRGAPDAGAPPAGETAAALAAAEGERDDSGRDEGGC